jgi:hypothetical protein
VLITCPTFLILDVRGYQQPMRKLILFITILQWTFCFSQSNEQKKTQKWIDKMEIQLNNPITPEGYIRQSDCKEQPIYRKEISDTIILYTWGGSIAEDLKTFKETTIEEGFNVYRYPSKVQSNGTVVVTRMSKDVFVWRNDSLYLLDSYNETASEAFIQIMKDHSAKKITTEEYKQKMENFDDNNYLYTPKFKVIYFNGIFENSESYKFAQNQNFREEAVILKSKWTSNGITYIEFNLDTHTNGRYRIATNLSWIESNNCKN